MRTLCTLGWPGDRKLNQMGLSSQGLTIKNVVLGRREMRQSCWKHWKHSCWEKPPLTGDGPWRSPVETQVRDPSGSQSHRPWREKGGGVWGTGVAAAQSRGAAAEGLTSGPRLGHRVQQTCEPCLSPGTWSWTSRIRTPAPSPRKARRAASASQTRRRLHTPPSCTHLTKSSGGLNPQAGPEAEDTSGRPDHRHTGRWPLCHWGVCQNVEAGLLELTDDPGRGSWRVTVPSGLGRGCHGDKWPGSDSCMEEWGVEVWTDWIWIRTSNCDQTRESEVWAHGQTESESEQDEQLRLMHGTVRRGHVDRLSLEQNQQPERFCVGCCLLCHWAESASESEVTQSCPTPSNPMDCSLPRSSVHGIF